MKRTTARGKLVKEGDVSLPVNRTSDWLKGNRSQLSFKAGPIAERSKSSDLNCGSNPGGGRNFFYFLSRW